MNFVLKEKIKETENVMTLKFKPGQGEIFDFKAGQFSTFSFLDNRAEGKMRAYTISSLPTEKFLSVAVKKAGIFSSALHNMKIGEKIEISQGQGRFYPESSMKNLVFLSAGIGIAPFYAVIKDFYKQKSKQKITLFYSNKTKKEIVFFKELNKIAKNWPSLKIIYFITREQVKDKYISECCRINIQILKKYLKNLNGKYYFICGPKEFVLDKSKQLKDYGVKDEFIKVEAF